MGSNSSRRPSFRRPPSRPRSSTSRSTRSSPTRKGQFIRDLTKDDFQVFEDGQRQTISTFTLVDIPIEKPDRPLYAEAPIEPDVKSNERQFDGRVYVAILDDLHTDAHRTANVRNAMHLFIERNLGENDLMAIVHTGGRTDAAQEFTNSKRLLLSAVDKFMGRKLVSATVARNEQYFRGGGIPGGRISDPYEQERAYNAQSTMRSLKEIAEWLSGLRGRRKTIIYVSEGIDYDITDVIRQYDAPTNSASMLIDDIRQTINAAARSNVAIYAIDPRGLTNLSDISIGVAGWADAQGGAASPDAPDARGIGASGLQNELFLSQINLRALAEETNGYAAVNSNDFTGAFDRIVRDNSSYYVLAYYPAQNRRDGKFHRIQVRVSRPGVTVRARRGYIAPRVRSVSARATPGAGSSAAVTEALNSPIGVSDLAMRVFAAPFKGTAPNASVLFGVELSGRDLSLDDGAKIEIAYFAVDASGKTKAGKTETVTLNLRPESKVRITENGLRFMGRMDLPPGRYTLRVATRDVTGGKVGSVSYDVEVPDFAKSPLSMSGVALASMSGSALMTARPDELTKGVLPASPTALRTFPQNDELAMFAEVYDRPTPQPHAVDITAIVRSDEGTVVFKNEEERQSSELQGTTGGYVYQARVPLTDLQPGPLRADAGGAVAGRRSPGGDQANPLPDNAGGSTEHGCTQCTGAPGFTGSPGFTGFTGCLNADARSRDAQQHRWCPASGRADGRGLGHAVERACRRAADAGRRLRARSGGGGVSRDAVDGRVRGRDRWRGAEGGRVRRPVPRNEAGAWRDRRAGDHVAVSPRRDAQGRRRRDVRARAVSYGFFVVSAGAVVVGFAVVVVAGFSPSSSSPNPSSASALPACSPSPA